MTADAACRGIREHDPDGAIVVVGDRARPAVQPAAADEGPLEAPPRTRSGAGRPSSASSSGSARPIVSLDHGEHVAVGRPRRELRLRPGAARDRRPSPPPAVRRRRGRLLPDAGRLPPRPRARRLGRALRRDRRRVHRLGARRVARLERARGRARLPGGLGLRARLPAGARRVRDRLLPRARRGGARRLGRRRGRGRRRPLDDGTELAADGVVAGLGIEPAASSPPAPGSRSATGSSSTTAAARRGEDVFAAGDVARFPLAALGDDASRARGPRATATAGRSAPTWPAPTSRTTTSRSSTPTCSTSATRRSAS